MIYPGMRIGPYSWTKPGTVVETNIEPFRLYGNEGKSVLSLERFEKAIDSEQEMTFIKSVYEYLKKVAY